MVTDETKVQLRLFEAGAIILSEAHGTPVRMTKRIGPLLALAFGAAFATIVAAKVKVDTQYDKSFAFTGLHTYAWHPTGAGDVKMLQKSDENPADIRTHLEPMIKRSVDEALASRGFTAAREGTPDLYVYYYVLIGPNITAQTMGQFVAPVPEWGLPPFSPSTTSFDVVEQGSLILDLSSPALQSMVWRGTAHAEVDRELTDQAREKRIRDAVQEMFKKFPPKPKK